MRRVTAPLSKMGAIFREMGEPDRLPLELTGGSLVSLDYDSPVASAQVKSALLLAGLVQVALTGAWQTVFSVAWISRWGMDAVLLGYFAPRKHRDRVLLRFLPVVEVLYIPYVLFFVPLGRSGRFGWKTPTT